MYMFRYTCRKRKCKGTKVNKKGQEDVLRHVCIFGCKQKCT